jgi:hypothetical protein
MYGSVRGAPSNRRPYRDGVKAMRWISSLSEKPVPHRPRILVALTNLPDAQWVHLLFTPSSGLRKGCPR